MYEIATNYVLAKGLTKIAFEAVYKINYVAAVDGENVINTDEASDFKGNE